MGSCSIFWLIQRLKLKNKTLKINRVKYFSLGGGWIWHINLVGLKVIKVSSLALLMLWWNLPNHCTNCFTFGMEIVSSDIYIYGDGNTCADRTELVPRIYWARLINVIGSTISSSRLVHYHGSSPRSHVGYAWSRSSLRNMCPPITVWSQPPDE
jgi:hypothetical protein